jgi:hypothetical protein
MSVPYPKIISAKALDDHTLSIEFSNGEQRTYAITRLLDKEVFSPLKNPGFFKNFTIAPGGYGLVWNDEVDISEYDLWLHDK